MPSSTPASKACFHALSARKVIGVNRLSKPVSAVAVIVASLSSIHAMAADVYWVDDSFGNWSNGAWSSTSGGPANIAYPLAGDDVHIVNPGATNKRIRYASFIPGALINSVEIDATGTGTMKMDMGEFGHALNTNRLDIGIDGQATFTQTADDNNTQVLRLGYRAGSYGIYNFSSGTLDVSNDVFVGFLGYGLFNQAGGTLTVGDELWLGGDGNGTYIQTGGSLNAAHVFLGRFSGSTGTATVESASWNITHDLGLGGAVSNQGSTGDLTVNQNGSVTVGTDLTVWNANSSIVTGTVSSTTGGQINVGGALTLSGGGTATGYHGVVDDVAFNFSNSIEASTAVITGAGSEWATRYFYTGHYGAGTTTVSNGGRISSTDDTFIGVISNSTGTLAIASGGTVDTDGNGFIGIYSGSAGDVTVGGSNARWDIAGRLYVGGHDQASGGTGTLTVNGGGVVDVGTDLTVWNADSIIRTDLGGGAINVGNALTLSGGGKAVGNFGIVDDGALVYANSIKARTAAITGVESQWFTDYFFTGNSGVGTTTVSDGGTIFSDYDTYVGTSSGSDGTLGITAGGRVGTFGNGYMGRDSGSTGAVTVSGGGALWDISETLYVGGSINESGGTGALTVNSGGLVEVNTDLKVWNANSSISTGTTSSTSGGQIDVGGALTLSGGGTATGYYGVVDGTAFDFDNSIEAPTAAISGAGSEWATRWFYTGRYGAGTTTVSNGGKVSSTSGTYIGAYIGSNGTLAITTGGTVDTDGNGFIGIYGGSIGAVTVGGSNARWDIAGGLYVGGTTGVSGGTGTLTVNSGGTVSVANNLTIWDNGTVNLSGGTINIGTVVTAGGTFNFNAGALNIGSDLHIGSGEALGNAFTLTQLHRLSVGGTTTIDQFSMLNLDGGIFTTGILTNNGQVNLDGPTSNLIGNTLDNTASGEILVSVGDTLHFSGAGNSNTGEVNLLGGTVRFDQGLSNQPGGFIGGRGTLVAGGGLENRGAVAFTGNAEVFGDIHNTGNGQIVASGGTTLTLFDDVVHNGLEIRASSSGGSSSSIVFLGSVSGAGPLTGGGNFYFEGDLRPGNSPTLLVVTGNATFGDLALTEIELGGLSRGTEYDAVDVSGTLTLAGTLSVVLFDLGGGLYDPQLGDVFDIFDASLITGNFAGINLPSLQAGLLWNTSLLEAEGLLSVSAVPLPPALWLLFSAVVGLIAVGRKSASPPD